MSSSAPGAAGPRFLVVGCGGIGGIVAAHLFEQGHDVVALTKNAVIADAINASGFIVRGDSAPGQVRGHAIIDLPKTAKKFDYVLLCTQPPQVEEAARSLLTALSPEGVLVCFQNGLCEERIARMAMPDRVFGAIVAWGASMVEPGIYDRTSSGGFAIGRLDGQPDPRLDALGRALEAIGPVTTTQNLRGARWSKLAINCAISSLGTLGGDRLGVLMRSRHVRRLALEIMTEVVEVARAYAIKLEKVSGTLDLEWIALTKEERVASGSAGLVAKHALLLAVGARYRRLRSSMLAAIERGRVPAVDFLNGEVSTRGREVGVATPINDAIRDEILLIAAGKAKSSHAALRAFFDRTRKLEGAGPVSMQPPTTVEAEPISSQLAPPRAVPGPTIAADPLESSLAPAAARPADVVDAPAPPSAPAASEVVAEHAPLPAAPVPAPAPPAAEAPALKAPVFPPLTPARAAPVLAPLAPAAAPAPADDASTTPGLGDAPPPKADPEKDPA
jgi:2-dehydropantoate 2-reductase